HGSDLGRTHPLGISDIVARLEIELTGGCIVGTDSSATYTAVAPRMPQQRLRRRGPLPASHRDARLASISTDSRKELRRDPRLHFSEVDSCPFTKGEVPTM